MNTVASGSFKNTIYTTSGLNIGTVTVNWTSTPNVNTNSSAVTVTVTVANSANSYRLRNRAYSISCLGSAYHGYTASASDTLANRPFTIYHNADGTKNGVISFYVAGFTFEEEDEEHNITTYTVNAFSVYGNAVLDTIARGSTPTLSASTVAMGNAITINTNRASDSFTHKLTYSFGNTTGTIAENVGASYPWTVPLDLAKQIPTTTSGTVTVYCETFNGSTSLGTKAVTFTATVPDTVKPTISKVVCTDPIGLATTYGGYVQGKSKVNVATTASGAYGSEISTCRVTIGSTTLAGTNVTSDVLYNSGSNSISVTVTDSRGRTASYPTSITVLAYTSPTITKFTAYRCDSDGTENPEGTYVKVAYAGAITALNNKNSKSFKVEYKTESAETYTSWINKTDAYTCDTTSLKSGFSTDVLYNLLFTVTDDFTSATYKVNIPTAAVLFDFLGDGEGIAFGKVATEEGFDCNFEGHFRQDVIAGYGTEDETSLLELKELIGTGGVVIDDALSDTSTNPVQNKVVTSALNDKASNSSVDSKKPIKRCSVGQSTGSATNPWYKFASITTSAAYEDKSITFKVSTGFDGSGTIAGILTAHFRVDGNKNWQRGELMWDYAGSGINLSDYVLAYKNTGTSCAVELWTKISTGYAHRFFEVLAESSRVSFVNEWTLHNVSQAGYADAITEGYTQIASTVMPRQAEYLASDTFPALTLKRNNSTGMTGISFVNNNGYLGHIAMTNTANGGLIRYSADYTGMYMLLDANNYQNYIKAANIGAAPTNHNHSGDYIESDGYVTGLFNDGGEYFIETTDGDVRLVTPATASNWISVVPNYSSAVSSGTVKIWKNPTLHIACVLIDSVNFETDNCVFVTNAPKAINEIYAPITDASTHPIVRIGTDGHINLWDYTYYDIEYYGWYVYPYKD